MFTALESRNHSMNWSIYMYLIYSKCSLIFSFLVTPYYKNKLKGLYKTAMQDAELEAEYDVLYLIYGEIKLISILLNYIHQHTIV